MNDELMKDISRRYFESRMNQFLEWMNSPRQKAMREEYRRQWLARPWYERAKIRAQTKIRMARVRLGEWIAGQSLDD